MSDDGEVLHVRIYGLPVAQARPRARVFHDRDGQARVSVYDPATSRDWKRTVTAQVLPHRPAAPLADIPLAMALVFYLARPQSLPRRVTEHIRRPDLDNLTKAVKDALRGVIYRDDSQIVKLTALKIYSAAPGVEIFVGLVVPGTATLVTAVPLFGEDGR